MKIKECPFCGGIGTLWSIDHDTVYAVCQDCGARNNMNEIEKTIRLLSDMKLSFSQKYIHEAFDVSIEALREKAEREKGCEYCNPNPYGHGEAIKQLITQIFNDKAHIHTFVRGNGLHTFAYPSPQDTNLAKTYSQCKIINYCPVCGKRLEVEP